MSFLDLDEDKLRNPNYLLMQLMREKKPEVKGPMGFLARALGPLFKYKMAQALAGESSTDSDVLLKSMIAGRPSRQDDSDRTGVAAPPQTRGWRESLGGWGITPDLDVFPSLATPLAADPAVGPPSAPLAVSPAPQPIAGDIFDPLRPGYFEDVQQMAIDSPREGAGYSPANMFVQENGQWVPYQQGVHPESSVHVLRPKPGSSALGPGDPTYAGFRDGLMGESLYLRKAPPRQIHTIDGQRMSEVSITVSDPRINDGLWTNIPSLYDGVTVSQEDAIQRVVNAGGVDPVNKRNLYPFESMAAAEAAAANRSAEILDPPASVNIGTDDDPISAKPISVPAEGQLPIVAPPEDRHLFVDPRFIESETYRQFYFTHKDDLSRKGIAALVRKYHAAHEREIKDMGTLTAVEHSLHRLRDDGIIKTDEDLDRLLLQLASPKEDKTRSIRVNVGDGSFELYEGPKGGSAAFAVGGTAPSKKTIDALDDDVKNITEALMRLAHVSKQLEGLGKDDAERARIFEAGGAFRLWATRKKERFIGHGGGELIAGITRWVREGMPQGMKETEIGEKAAEVLGSVENWAELSPEQLQELYKFQQFVRSTNENINLYIKFITGARMGIDEAVRLRSTQPDVGDNFWNRQTYTEFTANLQSTIGALERQRARAMYWKANGMEPPALTMHDKQARQDLIELIDLDGRTDDASVERRAELTARIDRNERNLTDWSFSHDNVERAMEKKGAEIANDLINNYNAMADELVAHGRGGQPLTPAQIDHVKERMIKTISQQIKETFGVEGMGTVLEPKGLAVPNPAWLETVEDWRKTSLGGVTR